MNRIILIGNGFDLAHGLKTSYRDFLDNYWAEWYKKLRDCKDCQLSDEFYEFSIKYGDQLVRNAEFERIIDNYIIHRKMYKMVSGEQHPVESFKDLSQLCAAINEHWIKGSQIHHQRRIDTSELFIAINKASMVKWVDIEDEYYQFLKKVYSNSFDHTDEVTAKMLNADLNNLKGRLISYLRKIQDEKITDDLVNNQIKEKIFEPFNLRDISNSGQELFLDYKLLEVSELPGGLCAGEIEEEMRNHPEYSLMNTEKGAYREMIKNKRREGKLDDFLLPNRILLLNFNYTNTAEKLYAKSENRKDCELINIHGELNNTDNPIIFGYGDEMDEDYKKIVNLNDNDYLQNIKSIRYLETDNYRNLLAFIDSAYYQIYIMGHSCGNSDRTLLNTLFEHKNCVSVKPLYHQIDETTDNYIDIVQNISRNFKDATLMRDRVVNKTYCEPLAHEK